MSPEEARGGAVHAREQPLEGLQLQRAVDHRKRAQLVAKIVQREPKLVRGRVPLAAAGRRVRQGGVDCRLGGERVRRVCRRRAQRREERSRLRLGLHLLDCRRLLRQLRRLKCCLRRLQRTARAADAAARQHRRGRREPRTGRHLSRYRRRRHSRRAAAIATATAAAIATATAAAITTATAIAIAIATAIAIAIAIAIPTTASCEASTSERRTASSSRTERQRTGDRWRTSPAKGGHPCSLHFCTLAAAAASECRAAPAAPAAPSARRARCDLSSAARAGVSTPTATWAVYDESRCQAIGEAPRTRVGGMLHLPHVPPLLRRAQHANGFAHEERLLG